MFLLAKLVHLNNAASRSPLRIADGSDERKEMQPGLKIPLPNGNPGKASLVALTRQMTRN
jgi:hypothetical protein